MEPCEWSTKGVVPSSDTLSAVYCNPWLPRDKDASKRQKAHKSSLSNAFIRLPLGAAAANPECEPRDTMHPFIICQVFVSTNRLQIYSDLTPGDAKTVYYA